MIRFIFVALFVFLFLVLSIPLLIAEWIIGKFNMDIKNRSSLAIVNWAFSCCIWISGTKVTYIGEDKVPTDTAVLFIANHRSYFDILLTYVRVKRPTGYVAKTEMLRYPLLRDWMKNLHCLFLDRSDVKKGMKTILDGIAKMKSGISICIFPEGTRNKENDTFLPFKDGSFKLAQKSGCPIVPISINNSAAVFEDHFPKIKKANVIIEYHDPIYLDKLSKEDVKNIGKYTQAIIEKGYFKNKELLSSNT